jgi:serine/threonine-protein kinase
MGSVLYGQLKGPAGFARAVAIKRMHPHIAAEPDFVTMFIDEARICARLSHVNIVPTLDVIEVPSELCLVMEYVHGAALDVLIDLTGERGELVPVRVAVALLAGVLHGLHAAHETRGDHGEPLSVVHRDVSPQNVLVGEDGVARVLDFGIAKAAGKLRSTPSGEVKGKLAYMAPEQFRGGGVDRRVDIYGAAAVLWEALIGRPLFDGQNESAVVYAVLNDEHVPPSRERGDVPAELDAIVLKGLSRDAGQRFATAREMALALERTVGGASQSEVSEWVRQVAGTLLDTRAADLRRIQQGGAASRVLAAQRALVPHGESSRRQPAFLSSSAASQRPGRWIVALLLLCAAAAGVIYVAAQPSGVAHEPSAVPALPPTRIEPVPPAPATSTEPAAEKKDTLDPQAEHAESAPQAPPRAEDKGLLREARGRERARAIKPSPKAGGEGAACSPPYWWSADGVKHYKRECL